VRADRLSAGDCYSQVTSQEHVVRSACDWAGPRALPPQSWLSELPDNLQSNHAINQTAASLRFPAGYRDRWTLAGASHDLA
jgi:hypothetical protein